MKQLGTRTRICTLIIHRHICSKSGGAAKALQCDAGMLHDYLWRVAALDFLKLLVSDAREGGRRVAFSFGSTSAPGSQLRSLQSHVNPEPPPAIGLATGRTTGFDFADCSAKAEDDWELEAEKPPCHADGLGQSDAGVVFFSVHDLSPGSYIVPLYSQKVEGQAPICVEQLAVVDVDEAAGTVSVALEDVKGQSNQALLIMDAHSLSNSVLKLLQIWQMSDELQYSFGVGIDSTDLRMKDAFAVITEGLLATKAPAASDGQRFNLVHADDPHCFKFRALKKLERAGVTLCLGDKRGQSAWCLTERYNVQIQRQLSGSRLALVPRDGSIDLENRHVLELHHELQKRGWQCFVKDTKRKVKQSKDKKKHKIAEKLESAFPVHEDYVAGEKKHFWLHHRAVHFHKLYYVALLMAEDNRIKLPVPHLARQKDYYKLIYGTDPTSKRCRGKFDFDGLGTKRRKRVVPAGKKTDAPVSDESNHASEAEAEPSSSESDRSSSSKSSSASSSSNSSSDSSGSGNSSNSGKHTSAKRVVATSKPEASLILPGQIWKGSKWTLHLSDAGEHIGYTVECPLRTHKGGLKCHRRRNFAKHGGEAIVVRMLKWWVCQGCRDDVDTRSQHMFEVKDSAAPDLPTLDWLEEQELPDDNC